MFRDRSLEGVVWFLEGVGCAVTVLVGALGVAGDGDGAFVGAVGVVDGL